MSKVVSVTTTEVEKMTSTVHEASVVLDDGRTGQGSSGGWMYDGNKETAIAEAIKDANSKPVD